MPVRRGFAQGVQYRRVPLPKPLMFVAAPLKADSKAESYAELADQARGLLAGERDRVANAAKEIRDLAEARARKINTAYEAIRRNRHRDA